MTINGLLPLLVLLPSLLPGLLIFVLPESWYGLRTTLAITLRDHLRTSDIGGRLGRRSSAPLPK